MSRKKKNKALQTAQKLQRKLAVQQGFFDGRYKRKVVADKKKEARKRLSRKNKIRGTEDQ